jgi:hypothetical protein
MGALRKKDSLLQSLGAQAFKQSVENSTQCPIQHCITEIKKKYVNIRISPTNGIESPPPKLYEKNNSYREALI